MFLVYLGTMFQYTQEQCFSILKTNNVFSMYTQKQAMFLVYLGTSNVFVYLGRNKQCFYYTQKQAMFQYTQNQAMFLYTQEQAMFLLYLGTNKFFVKNKDFFDSKVFNLILRNQSSKQICNFFLFFFYKQFPWAKKTSIVNSHTYTPSGPVRHSSSTLQSQYSMEFKPESLLMLVQQILVHFPLNPPKMCWPLYEHFLRV